jgi:hypothetical protein
MFISRPPSSLQDKDYAPLPSICKTNVKIRLQRASACLDGKTAWKSNSHCIEKNLDTYAGRVENASGLGNGTWLVQVLIKKQFKKLLKATFLGSYPINIERHGTELLSGSD